MSFETPKSIRPHWNYFLALERDLESTSRYVEFSTENLETYSIEFAHLLLSSASEIDTIAKCICAILDPTVKTDNINKYRKVIKTAEESQKAADIFGTKHELHPLPDNLKHRLSEIKVFIPRYGIQCIPWKSWAVDKNPDWWTHYNNVKHERNKHFNKATLRNVVNALAGLLAINYLYCRLELCKNKLSHLSQCRGDMVTRYMQPDSTFMRLERAFYADVFSSFASFASYISSEVESFNSLG
jgi:hypothetical protein